MAQVTEKQKRNSAKNSKKNTPIYYKTGRPTKYKKKFCKDIIKYFDIPPYKEEEVVKYFKGEPYRVVVKVPNRIPTIERFAMEICNATKETIHEWRRVHPEFSDAYEKAKVLQKDFLVYQSAYGFITPSYAVFLTKAMTDLREVNEVDITSKGDKLEGVNLTSVLSELKNKSIDDLQREA